MEPIGCIIVPKTEWEEKDRLIQTLKGQLKESREERKNSREWSAVYQIIIGALVMAIVMMQTGGI